MSAAAAISAADEGLDMDRGFVHTVRPAAGLSPVDTAAPNSVFALGGAPPAETVRTAPAPRGARATSRHTQALETLQSCGPITVFQFADAMQISRKAATQLLSNLKIGGKVISTRNSAGLSLFSIAGEQTMRSSSKSVQRATPVEPTPPVGEAPDPELACAIFNNGGMLLEAPNSVPLRLTPRQAGELIAYLRTLQGGLR